MALITCSLIFKFLMIFHKCHFQLLHTMLFQWNINFNWSILMIKIEIYWWRWNRHGCHVVPGSFFFLHWMKGNAINSSLAWYRPRDPQAGCVVAQSCAAGSWWTLWFNTRRACVVNTVGDQRRYWGGTNARRWAASQSRDTVVMIVMSVRAASVCWGWYTRGTPAVIYLPKPPFNETERARNRDANQIGVEAETWGWGSGAIGSPTAERREDIYIYITLMENVSKEVILIRDEGESLKVTFHLEKTLFILGITIILLKIVYYFYSTTSRSTTIYSYYRSVRVEYY